jgi:hypothetical protein
MTVYAWPFKASRFELRIQPNTRVFVGPYTPTTQVLDFLGERWAARIDMPPPRTAIEGAAREAFFDRLKGPANQIQLWHLRLPYPQGTLRGSPTTTAAGAQGANTIVINGAANATLRAGDMFGLNGELKRCMADLTLDGSGNGTVEFQPRVRGAFSSGAAITWNKPTANFMLKSDGVPTSWVPGYAEGCSFELIEAL